ncbi:hypothetical protein ACFQ7F_40585 [Streptomyces sp. NPDC056486]|uniref:hypothetical protein n=1 Tax=Streptomyces sp. NPDC056486 TaxID=3345835 RepID=UPI00367589D0
MAIIAGISQETSKTVKVSYEVTGKGSDVVISYSTWHGDTGSISQETVTSLPWTKEETTTGLVKGGTLNATLGASGGSLKCSVTVADGKPKTATASGPFATASCSGF